MHTEHDAAVDRYITLTNTKRNLEASLRPVKAELAELEATIAQGFEAIGRQAETRNGATVYLARDLTWSARESTDEIVAALRKARLGDLIGVSYPKMRSWLKERLENPDTGTWELDDRRLPPSLRAVLELGERTSVRCRKAGG